MFAIACFAAVIAMIVSVDLLRWQWPNADLRRRWNERPTRRRFRGWLTFR